MRAYELYETDFKALGLIDVGITPRIGDTRKPKLTLRHINRLKHIRRNRQKAVDEKKALLPVMYGGAEQFERQQQEMLADKLKIEQEIEDAEVSYEQRKKIEAMAIRALEIG